MDMLIEYDPATGRPQNVMTAWPPDMPAHLRGQGRSCIVVPMPNAMQSMVVDGRLVPRPPCPVSVTVDGPDIVIADRPPGTVVMVEIEGVQFAVPAGDGALAVDEPGPLRITITPPWPYLEAVHDLDVE